MNSKKWGKKEGNVMLINWAAVMISAIFRHLRCSSFYHAWCRDVFFLECTFLNTQFSSFEPQCDQLLYSGRLYKCMFQLFIVVHIPLKMNWITGRKCMDQWINLYMRKINPKLLTVSGNILNWVILIYLNQIPSKFANLKTSTVTWFWTTLLCNGI